MTIRKATIQDKEALMHILNEFNDYYYDEHIFSKEYLPFWEYKDKQAIFTETVEKWFTEPGYIIFIAEENGEIVGHICGQVRERKPRILDKEGYVHDFFVQKEWRGKGIGTRLFNALLDVFKEQHCNRLGILTNVGNKKTIDFYHNLGFIDEALTMVGKI